MFNQQEIKKITDILGYTVIDSQKLEYSLAYLMLLLNNEFRLKQNQQNEKIDLYMQNLSLKTMGSLIKKLNTLVILNSETKTMLDNALKARNYIIHTFLNDQGEKLLTKQGRLNAVLLLKEKRKIICDCYDHFDPIILKISEIKGLNISLAKESLISKIEK